MKHLSEAFDAVMNALPQLVWITDSKGSPIFINSKWAEYTGEDLDHVDPFKFYHPDDVAEIESTWRTALAKGTSYEFEFRIRSKQGEYRWFLSRGTLIRGAAGPDDSWFGTCTDIHDQKLAIESAKEAEATRAISENRFRAIVEQSPFPTQLLTQAGKTLQVNHAWRKLWDVSDDVVRDFILKDYNILQDPLMDEIGLRASLTRAFAGEAVSCAPVFYEPEKAGRSGRARWVESYFAPIRTESNEMTEIILLFNDVTDRVESEKQQTALLAREEAALEASKLKSEFLANMSHEIRTPINGVVGMTGLLADTDLTEEQMSFVEAIKQSSQTLLTVINDILDFSRIEAGKLEFEHLHFDLRDVVKSAQQTVAFAASAKKIDLQVELSPHIPYLLQGDPARIKQVLLNLLSNAVKFTNEGAVHLVVEKLSESDRTARIRFEVRDTGIGISKDALSKIFESFSQEDASTNRRFGGSGLGLAICKRLVEQMNGSIGVVRNSTSGSTFWFEIELARQAPSFVGQPAESARAVSQTFLKKHRILVVEDNQINQIIAVRMLEKMNLHADVAANGIEAIDALETLPYDLVLMDCHMPEMDGYEATRTIRASGSIRHPGLPIIAMTANAMKDDVERCTVSGMNAHISKPVDSATLFKILAQYLNADDETGEPRPLPLALPN